MTFLQLIDRFKARFIGHELGDPLIKEHLNIAYKNFLAEAEFPMEETSTVLTITAGSRSVALPANVFSVLAVRDDTNNVKLTPMYGWGNMFQRFPDPAETGDPQNYRVIGPNLHIFPTPASNTNIEIFYSQEPADMVANADVPILPNRYHDGIVLMALSTAHLDDNDPDMAQTYASAYQSYVQQAVDELRNVRMERYPSVWDDFYEDF